jgi:CelD/BcsL family acetyltransferase involved in cellulose biosynthesis
MVTRVEILRDPDWHIALWDEWTELYRSSTTATPFQSPAWIAAWCTTIGKNKAAHVVTVRDGSELVALFPMAISRTPWRALRFMATGVSDILQPLVRSGFEPFVGDYWRQACENLRGVDLIDLHQMRTESCCAFDVLLSMDRQADCPLLDLPASFDEYTKMLSKSLRYDVNKGFRGEFEWKISDTAEQAQANFDVFLHLHSQRWRKRGLPGAFGLHKIQEFHRAFLALAGKTVELETLWHDAQPIGALYVMATDRSSFFYQSGFDPAAKKLCPGTVLVATAIRRAIDEGRRQFDFLRGDEPYKMRWQPQRVVPNYRYMRSVGSVRGSVGKWANNVEAAVETRIRRRLEGRGLIS